MAQHFKVLREKKRGGGEEKKSSVTALHPEIQI